VSLLPRYCALESPTGRGWEVYDRETRTIMDDELLPPEAISLAQGLNEENQDEDE
jgi:hypothetical protein